MVKKIKNISGRHMAFGILFVVTVLYTGFQTRFLVFGSEVEILYPQNGALLASSVVSVKGVAKDVAWVSLNGRQIFTDEEGYWKEDLVLSPGPSIVTIKTMDRYGRETEKSVQIITN